MSYIVWLSTSILTLVLALVGAYQWHRYGHKTWGLVSFGLLVTPYLAYVLGTDRSFVVPSTGLIVGSVLWLYLVTGQLFKLYFAPWTMRWFHVPMLALLAWVVGHIAVDGWLRSHLQDDYFLLVVVSVTLLGPFYMYLVWIWLVGMFYTSEEEREHAIQGNNASAVYYAIRMAMFHRAMEPSQWLELTKAHPQFMQSHWWKMKGQSFWPDILEWETKMGTLGMVWLFQERMVNPPIEVDDYSSAGAVWAEDKVTLLTGSGA